MSANGSNPLVASYEFPSMMNFVDFEKSAIPSLIKNSELACAPIGIIRFAPIPYEVILAVYPTFHRGAHPSKFSKAGSSYTFSLITSNCDIVIWTGSINMGTGNTTIFMGSGLVGHGGFGAVISRPKIGFLPGRSVPGFLPCCEVSRSLTGSAVLGVLIGLSGRGSMAVRSDRDEFCDCATDDVMAPEKAMASRKRESFFIPGAMV